MFIYVIATPSFLRRTQSPAYDEYAHTFVSLLGTPETRNGHGQAIVSLELKKTVDAGVGRTFAVIIEGG